MQPVKECDSRAVWIMSAYDYSIDAVARKWELRKEVPWYLVTEPFAEQLSSNRYPGSVKNSIYKKRVNGTHMLNGSTNGFN